MKFIKLFFKSKRKSKEQEKKDWWEKATALFWINEDGKIVDFVDELMKIKPIDRNPNNFEKYF